MKMELSPKYKNVMISVEEDEEDLEKWDSHWEENIETHKDID